MYYRERKNPMNFEYIDKIIYYFNQTYEIVDYDICINVCCEKIINDIIKFVNKKKYSIEEKVENLERELKNQIVKYLMTYKREEVNIGLLYLKAYCRIKISNASNELNNFEYSIRQDEILNLMHIENESQLVNNNSIVNGSKNMEIAFRLSYFYCVLKDNIEHYKKQTEKFNPLIKGNIALMFEEGYFYTKEYSEYMDAFLFMNLYEIPEDSEIKTNSIIEQMKRKKCTVWDIEDSQGIAIKHCFGFNFKDLRIFTNFLFEHQNNGMYFFMKKDQIINEIDKKYGIGNEIKRIIEYFSLDFQTINKDENINKIRLLELKSILEIEDSILIYPLELCYNIGCFEKIALRNHFFEYLTFGLDNNQKDDLRRLLSKHEEKMSTFLAYVLLDTFVSNGYIVPEQNQEPMVEIRSIIKVIEDKKQKNILKDKGDIDVLAADRSKREIYNIEIKYYKPLENVEEMYSLNKENERNKNVKTPLYREKILYNNMKEVLAFLGLDPNTDSEYKIRTIFVTPRPDYWLKKCSRGVEYYEWVEILDAIKKRLL